MESGIIQNMQNIDTEMSSVLITDNSASEMYSSIITNSQYASFLKQETIYSPEGHISSVSTEGYQTTLEQNLSINQNLRVKNFNDLANNFNAEVQNNLLESEITFKTTDDESMAVEALRQLGGMYPGRTTLQESCLAMGMYDNVVSTVQNFLMLSCDNCESKFHTTTELNIHIITCKNMDYKKYRRCTFCATMFNREQDYENHNCDSLDHLLPCKYCSEKFSTNLELIKHIRSIHNNESRPYKCHLCHQNFPRHSSLSNHLKIHNYQPGRALFINCDNKINMHSDATGNTVKLPSWTTESDYIPDNSGIICIDPLSNWNYNPNVMPMEPVQEIEVVGEELIVSVVPQDLVGIQTVKVEPKPFSEYIENCIEDPFESSSIPQVDIIVDDSTNSNGRRPNICSNCGMGFSREKALFNHLKLHAINWQSTHDCENCGESFIDENVKTQHSKMCTKVNSPDQDETLYIKSKSITNAVIKQSKNTKVVSSSLGSSKPQVKVGKHQCTDCDKRFATKQKMFRHMWIHRKKTFTCEICAMTFQIQNDLDKHRLSMHPADSPYVCQECGKSFASRQGLWEHGRVHGGGTAGLFTCQICKKKFASRQGYLIHQRSHTGERPYGCRYCLKAFRDGGTLRKHERIHTGERPHVCPICMADFNQKVVLREHVRWRHAAYKKENENGTVTCQVCEASVSDKEELCAHIVKHSDQIRDVNVKEETKAKIKRNIQVRKNPQQRLENTDLLKTEESLNGEEMFAQSTNLPSLHTGNQSIDELFDNLPEKSSVQCDMCGKTFPSQKELIAHVHIHI